MFILMTLFFEKLVDVQITCQIIHRFVAKK